MDRPARRPTLTPVEPRATLSRRPAAVPAAPLDALRAAVRRRPATARIHGVRCMFASHPTATS
ncbi:hypothetical protein ACIGT4_15220 [Streptomyces sioyaensis]|uniref:hypothetical protein n=1 Tax=Streptomyces sioyaensis TaxID=67364 RepID=UPI0037D92544